MHLVIPGLVDLPRNDAGPVAIYEVNAGAKLEVHPLVALPAELDRWGREVVWGGTPDRVRVLAVSEQTTDLGWPVTISLSELVDLATGEMQELRLHTLFRFLEFGGIAVLRAVDHPSFDTALEFIKPLIADTRPDFHGDEVPALALVWAGL